MVDLVASNGVLHLCIMNGVEEALAVLEVLHGTGWKEGDDEDLHAMQYQVSCWYAGGGPDVLCIELSHSLKTYALYGGGWYSDTRGGNRRLRPTVYVTAEYWITQALHPNYF